MTSLQFDMMKYDFITETLFATQPGLFKFQLLLLPFPSFDSAYLSDVIANLDDFLSRKTSNTHYS